MLILNLLKPVYLFLPEELFCKISARLLLIRYESKKSSALMIFFYFILWLDQEALKSCGRVAHSRIFKKKQ
jgi:hypothetical protein